MHPSKGEERQRVRAHVVVVNRSASADDSPKLEQGEQLRVAQRLLAAMRDAGYVVELNDDPTVA